MKQNGSYDWFKSISKKADGCESSSYDESKDESCAFALWKENRFFSSKKKTITKTVAAALLKDGRVSMSGLFSEKTGKTYDAVVVLDDTGEKYVNFKLEFPCFHYLFI